MRLMQEGLTSLGAVNGWSTFSEAWLGALPLVAAQFDEGGRSAAFSTDKVDMWTPSTLGYDSGVKLFLTSAGIKNETIRNALVDELGKPIVECNALCIPTASYGHPMVTPASAWRFIAGQEPRCPMTELGWKSVGLLELTALPTISAERWVPWVRDADVLLVNGGGPLYLTYWLRQSGLADLLPSLCDMVWVGLSAGSMVMTPRVGEWFVESKPSITGDDAAPGSRRVLDLPPPGSPGSAPEHHGQRGTMGGRHPESGICDRR